MPPRSQARTAIEQTRSLRLARCTCCLTLCLELGGKACAQHAVVFARGFLSDLPIHVPDRLDPFGGLALPEQREREREKG